MNKIQTYAILNSIQKQAYGDTAVTVTDATWVSVGNEILSDVKKRDSWYKALGDVLVKTVIAIRTYEAHMAGMLREEDEYGAMVRKIAYKDIPAQKNWSYETESALNPFEIFKNEIVQKVYDTSSTWEHDLTRPDIQLKTAFRTPEDMAAYLEGLMVSFHNSMQQALEYQSNLCRANLIAMRVTNNVNMTAINLLDKYNTEMGKTLTAPACFTVPEFCLYCVAQINLTITRMSRLSTRFNDGEVSRFGEKEKGEVKLVTLADFDSYYEQYVLRTSYRTDGIGLPEHEKVPYWQGSGDGYDFDSVSSVKVSRQEADASGNVTAKNYSASGVIALVHDRDAMAMTIKDMHTNTIFNPRQDYTNYFAKADVAWMNDLSEMSVVFYVENPATPPTPGTQSLEEEVENE